MMKNQLTLLLILFTTLVCAQNKKVHTEILSTKSVSKLFTDSLKQQLGIKYPIYRVYKCTDKSGEFYILLTESNGKITEKKDTIHEKIMAFNISQNKDKFSVNWKMSDFIIKQKDNGGIENSIWFWTKYSDFKDIDSDNMIDPIVVYGTSGTNNLSNGRIQILIYYKGQKVAIRHQNGVLDSERNTQVDKEFYFLPQKLQDHIKLKMKKISDDGNAIFPHKWQDNMNKQKLKFDER